MVNISMIDSYLDTVAGYVCDEDKLVTYKWLSKELEVHVNLAKIILWRYWERCKKEQLVATFMLIGNLKSGGTRVEVVLDADLEKAKEKFENILSEHVYSLQKALTSIELLAGSGKGDSRFSAIKCEESTILSDEELARIRWGKSQASENSTEKKRSVPIVKKKEPAATNDPPKLPDEKAKETEKKSEDAPVKKISPQEKDKSNDKKGAVNKKPIQSAKTGFGNLFGNVTDRQKKQTDSSNVRSDEKSVKPTIEKPVEKIEAKEMADSASNKNEEPKESSEKNSAAASDRDTTSKLAVSKKTVAKSTSNKKMTEKKNEKSGGGKKRGRSRDSENESKKRKRIFVASDSSEDSASEENDMFGSSSPEEPVKIKEKSPSPPLTKSEGNKRKVRKMVDKTFQDEDGFVITKKVYVYESCSEEEPEVEEKKTEPEIAKETKLNTKKKQATLNAYFKKA